MWSTPLVANFLLPDSTISRNGRKTHNGQRSVEGWPSCWVVLRRAESR